MSESANQDLAADQTVLGYTLRERIGSGGYGEVWSAEAPGGMLKAVKFVYGFHDETRAQRELKALDRIKHIRHPFLLSLERIDIVDGRMVVITELADMCLKTRFNQCREEGLEAIPREELMRYMRESADALDYIAEGHSLAHLDIKPENLLIVGGHAKVADFGLVKDFQSVNQSLMEGLTPSYAAPELFDGRPCRASDQYSLAIVYQELLTATRPFSGTTTAQLAHQHLHSWPNLNSLPRGDQAVIARALAKDPEKRFSSCRVLVEELTKRKNRIRTGARTQEKPKRESLNTCGQTNVESDVPGLKRDSMTMSVSDGFMPAMNCKGEIEKAAPLELDESAATIRPTLFIGVGNTGTRALCQLRKRLTCRYGDPDMIPSFRFLCIDVDRKALFESMGSDPESMRNHELLNIPLRKPEEYRSDSELDLGWIGRRWIYNIPKSQLTESLRPLGRLAFVDHHEAIFQRLLDELNHLSREEHLATTAENTGLYPSQQSPRVILVSSVSGGTGSGMLLDLAYTVRIAMSERGLSDDSLFGLFAHSTSRHAGDHRLAIANSYSFLSELYHYNLNGYPGSEGCRLPEFDNETPVFDGTWLVHLGNDLQHEEYDCAIDALGNYLYLGTATRCTAFFDRCRDSREFDPGYLKTMGIGYFGQGKPPLAAGPTGALAGALVGSWLDTSQDKSGQVDDHRALAEQMLVLSELEDSRLESGIRLMLTEHFGGEPVKKLLEIVNEQLGALIVQGERRVPAAIDELLDSILGTPSQSRLDSDPQSDPTACANLEARLPAISRQNHETISTAILKLIDDPKQRLSGTRQVVEEMLELLQLMSVSHEARRSQQEQNARNCHERFREILDTRNHQKRVAACHEVMAEQVAARFSQLVETFMRRQIQSARRDLTGTLSTLDDYTEMVRTMHQQIGLQDLLERSGETCSGDNSVDLHDLLEQWATDMTPRLLPALDQRINKQVLEPEGGLQGVLREGRNRVKRMYELICREACQMVNGLLQELRLDEILSQADVSVDRVAGWLEEIVQSATPRLAGCGGTSRMIIAVPQQAPISSIAAFLQQKMDHQANVIPATCGEFAVCIEMDQIPTEHVAMSILQLQPDCAELINRLHSRNDVEWSTLTPLC